MKELAEKLRGLKLKRPEAIKDQLTLYPAGCRLIKYKKDQKQSTSDDPHCGPKPLDIRKVVKTVFINKNKNKNSRGGKKYKIKKNIEQLKEVIEDCKTEEEKNRFRQMLAKAKNDLNRLNKKKPIKNY